MKIEDTTPPWPTITDDDGSGKTGTKLNKPTFWDVIRDAINSLIHSAAHPNDTPATCIEEVIAARGSMGSVDARLDVSLNEDGTPKPNAAYVTLAEYKDGVLARDLMYNGDLEDWSAGGSAAPDGFTLSAGTIARTGPLMGDTFQFGAGKYAAKLTRAGADLGLLQDIITSGVFAYAEECKGRKFVFIAKGKTAIASHLRLSVFDGVTESFSSYHTGGGAAEHLSVVHTISDSATSLTVQANVENSNGDAYVGGLQCGFGDHAPSDWKPLSREPVATATRTGLVSIVAQVFEGIKSFLKHPQFQPGASSGAYAQVRGLLDVQHNSIGVTTANETDAHTYTLKANTFNQDKRVVKVTMWGTIPAAAGNQKLVKFYFGGTALTVFDTVTNTNKWRAEVYIVRTSVDNQKMFSTVVATSGMTMENETTMTKDDGADIIMKDSIQSVAGGAGDITAEGWMVEVVG